MSVFAEFVGGPWDGELREMPDGRDRWYVPVVLRVSITNPPPQFDTLIYEKVGRRTVDSPTGEPVFRFVLQGHST